MRNKRPKPHRNRNSLARKENLVRIALIILIVIAGIVLPRLIHKGSNLLVENLVNTRTKETEPPETEETGMYSTGGDESETEEEHTPPSAAPSSKENTGNTPPQAESETKQSIESETQAQAPEPEPQTDASGMVSVTVPGGDTTQDGGADQTGSGTQDGSNPSDGGQSAPTQTGQEPSATPAHSTASNGNVTEMGTSLLSDDEVMSGPEIHIEPSGIPESVDPNGMDQSQVNNAIADANYVANFSPRIVLATESFEEDLFGPGDTDGQTFLKRVGTYVVDTFGNWVTVPTVEVRERISGSKELGNTNYRIKMYVENDLGETEEHFAIVTYYPDIKDYSVSYADSQE